MVEVTAELVVSGVTTLLVGYIAWKAKSIHTEWERRGDLLDRLARIVLGKGDTGRGLVKVVENHERLQQAQFDELDEIQERVEHLVEVTDQRLAGEDAPSGGEEEDRVRD